MKDRGLRGGRPERTCHLWNSDRLPRAAHDRVRTSAEEHRTPSVCLSLESSVFTPGSCNSTACRPPQSPCRPDATTLTRCSWTWPSVESSRSSEVCRRSAGANNSHGAGGVSEKYTARSTVSGSFEMRRGSHVVLPRNSVMSWAVAATGQWYSEFVEGFRQFITPRSLVVDVSASLGLCTVQLTRISSQRDGEVWAFEPYSDDLRWLNHNVRANEPPGDRRDHRCFARCRRGHELDSRGARWRQPVVGSRVPSTRGQRASFVLRLDDSELSARMSLTKLRCRAMRTRSAARRSTSDRTGPTRNLR